MHPNLLSLYAIEFQRERQRNLLNLTPEERLIRKAKREPISNGIKLPNINPFMFLRAFGKRIPRPKKATTVVLCSEPIRCASCGPFQEQVC